MGVTVANGRSAKADVLPTSFGPCSVIVADDEHLVALGIASNLRDLGHQVLAVAADGEAAVAAARQHKPDLAVLDIRMPKLTGPEVAKLIHEELGVPSLIVSAFSDEDYVRGIQANGLHSGVFGYLVKPVGRDQLRVQIGVTMHRASIDDFRVGRIGQLEKNLANRRVVEQAKWKMVARLGISEEEAHNKLQKVARDRRLALVDIARGVLDSDDLLT